MPALPLLTPSWYGPMSKWLTSGDATDALSRSSRGELEDRIMGKTAQLGAVSHSLAHTYRAWIYTCTTCQRHLRTDCHAKEIGKTPVTRVTGPVATPPTAAPVPPESQTSTSHEHLLDLLSKMDALLQLQTINGSQEDLTAIVRRFDSKPLTARCKRRKPTQRLKSRDC